MAEVNVSSTYPHSGEEDEEIIYCDNVELFRYEKVSKTWKERCIGELKLLQNSESKKTRILMRRDVTFKVCANHFITVDMKVSAGPISETSAVWSANDFSEEVLKVEIFAARFKTLEKTRNFHIVFENSVRVAKEYDKAVDLKVSVLNSPSKLWIGDSCKGLNKSDIDASSDCSSIEGSINVISSPDDIPLGRQIQKNSCKPKGNINDSAIKNSLEISVETNSESTQLKQKKRRHSLHQRHRKCPWKLQVNEDPLIWDMKTLLKGSQFSDESLPNDTTLKLHELSFNLVKILSECHKFSISLASLKTNHKYDCTEINQIVNKYSNTFELKNSILSLKPTLKICKAHSESEYCKNKDKCSELHICPKYIQKLCNSENCLLGHSWDTNHNQQILRAHSVDTLQDATLNNLLLSMSLNENSITNNLQICMKYNSKLCYSHSCNDLHFCLAFLAKHCVSSGNNCDLCHSTSNEAVVSVLSCHGISVNESPKDTLHSIASCPSVKESIKKFINQTEGLRPYISTENSSESRFDLKVDCLGRESNLHCDRSMDLKSKKTVWSHYYLGDIEIAEICNNSVLGYCPFEDFGCKRIHSHRNFHWQVRDEGRTWVNLPDYQVIAIERSFCDPDVDVVDIPILNPSKLDQGTMSLVTTLRGRSQWEANFLTMQLTLKNRSVFENSTSLVLRRLSVPFGTFLWYFSDKNKNWIEYGVADSTGNESLVSSINSADIENHLITNPTAPLAFKNSKFTYILDVLKLIQTNLDTNVCRNVKRRPKLDMNIGLSDDSITNDDLPASWEPMDATERSRKVTLLTTSREFQKVISLLTENGDDLSIVKIERIQNIFLYRAFQNKIHEMTSSLKNKRAVDVQTLFHGTRPDNVLAICDENFDWRLYGNNVGHKYGKGTYFTSSLKMALSYSTKDFVGRKFMFVAKVAVGSKVQGENSMSRPPINPKTNLPYDSTVNSLTNPIVFVKYDKQEYYPEYLITL